MIHLTIISENTVQQFGNKCQMEGLPAVVRLKHTHRCKKYICSKQVAPLSAKQNKRKKNLVLNVP